MRFEADEISRSAASGTAAPWARRPQIANTEWPKWTEDVPEPGAPSKVLTQPPPGPCRPAGMRKYGFDDARDVLELLGPRTVACAAAAHTGLLLLSHLGVSVLGHIVGLGEATTAPDALRPGSRTSTPSMPVPCAASTPRVRKAMVAAVKAAAKDGDSLGGVAEVLA